MAKKPVDEDRARRKAELERKRAARKLERERQAVAEAAALEQVRAELGALQLRDDDGAARLDADGGGDRCSLLGLPEDAVRLIFLLLPAADLGCLTMTCRTLHGYLEPAWVSHLRNRLGGGGATSSPRLHLCDRDAEVERLLARGALRSSDDNATRKPAHQKGSPTPRDTILSYARFVEDAMGHAALALRTTSSFQSRRQDALPLPAGLQGRFASASPEHSLCRVSNGAGCASWGVGARGQLGHGKRRDERQPRRLEWARDPSGLLDRVRIVQVSAGGGLVRVAHSLLLTSAGRVLSFGTGQYGALGHGYSAAKQLPDALAPQYIQALGDVTCICVAAGELHSAAVTSDGDLYTWGDGFCGQLGHADKRPRPSPRQVTAGGLEDECVAVVTCGGRHTIAVTEDGDVFSWGLGHFGCLGRSFTPFDYDADAAVVAFAGGDMAAAMQNAHAPAPMQREDPVVQEQPAQERDFAAELREHIDLLANMTLDDSSDQCIPQPVLSLQSIKIVSASAGHRHSLFLSEDGALYSCGAGTFGCLGHGDTVSQMYPMLIGTLDDDNVRVAQMSAGVDMSMAVASDGRVYSWGKMDGGRIGLGSDRKAVTMPRQVTIDTSEGEAVEAVDVECGYVHSLIVGIDGSVHLCGGVGVEGEDDGQTEESADMPSTVGRPRPIPDLNIWRDHSVEDKEPVKKERWSKYGKYTIKGRTRMLNGED